MSEIFTMRHYIQKRPVTCTIETGNKENFVTLKLIERSDILQQMEKGDPILFGECLTSGVKITGANIIKAESKEKLVTIFVNSGFFYTERRQYDRYPVSILANLKGEFQGCIAYIKDLSYSGLRFFALNKHKIGEVLDIDICLYHEVSSYKIEIVHESTLYGRYEYGAKIIHDRRESMDSAITFVNRLVEHEKELAENIFLKSQLLV